MQQQHHCSRCQQMRHDRSCSSGTTNLHAQKRNHTPASHHTPSWLNKQAVSITQPIKACCMAIAMAHTRIHTHMYVSQATSQLPP